MRLRSVLRFAGTHRVTRYPSEAPSIASAIPVFPDVASRRIRSFVSPDRSAARNIPSAARSLTLPPGFRNSAFAHTCTRGATWATNRSSRRSGVWPMRSATCGAFGDFAAEPMRSRASGPDVRLLAEGELEHVERQEGAKSPKAPNVADLIGHTALLRL